jgi:hypothetical protein
LFNLNELRPKDEQALKTALQIRTKAAQTGANRTIIDKTWKEKSPNKGAFQIQITNHEENKH